MFGMCTAAEDAALRIALHWIISAERARSLSGGAPGRSRFLGQRIAARLKTPEERILVQQGLQEIAAGIRTEGAVIGT